MTSNNERGGLWPLEAKASSPSGPSGTSLRAIVVHMGAMAALAGLLAVTRLEGAGALLIAPFGATAMLAIAAPDLPFSQPRAIIGGNVLAALCGLLAAQVFGGEVLGLVFAAALAMGAMLLTRTAHAPAAATAILAASGDVRLGFVVFPVLLGAMAIVAFAVLYHRLVRGGAYPRQWI